MNSSFLRGLIEPCLIRLLLHKAVGSFYPERPLLAELKNQWVKKEDYIYLKENHTISPIKLMRRKAAIDLIVLVSVFWGSWLAKSMVPPYWQGAFVVVLTAVVALLIMKWRGITFSELGFQLRRWDRNLVGEIFVVSFIIFAIQLIGIVVIGALVGQPEAGSAVTTQPTSTVGFFLDLLLMTWVVTALGEEFIFRGIIINRLSQLFGGVASSYRTFLISGIQAVWFGMAHMSQGVTGMLITGLIGFALGIYFLKNFKSGLWPLIFAHALIDTVVLTMAFVSSAINW